MLQLILTVFSIALVASLAAVTVHYAPGWVATEHQTFAQVRAGFDALDRAFEMRVRADAGTAPTVDSSRADGGLVPAFEAYYAFLPRAPSGYAWTYGFTSETQLLADGYTGFASGGLHWFCLYSTSSNASEGVFRGIKRAQQLFAMDQYFINANGFAACGRPIENLPTGFPTALAATLFVRYIADAP